MYKMLKNKSQQIYKSSSSSLDTHILVDKLSLKQILKMAYINKDSKENLKEEIKKDNDKENLDASQSSVNQSESPTKVILETKRKESETRIKNEILQDIVE